MSIFKETIISILKKKSSGAIIRNAKLGHICHISGGTRFYNSSIEDYSYIGRNSYFFKTNIGKYCSIADGCNCGMPEHRLDIVSTSPVFLTGSNRMSTCFGKLNHKSYEITTIENDIWIGTNVTIRAGVKIRTGAVIGMGSIVTKDVPAYAIVAGNPAKVIRYRFDESTRNRLLQSNWWDLDRQTIQRLAVYFDKPDILLSEVERIRNGE